MPNPPSNSRLQFDLSFGQSRPSARPRENAPFRLLVLGDFGGHTAPGARPAVATARPRVVEADQLDDLPGIWRTGVAVTLDDLGAVKLQFKTLEDFHPDRLLEAAPIFAELRQFRRNLLNPASASATADQVRAWLGQAAPAPASAAPTAGPAAAPGKEPNADLLGRLLGRETPAPARGVDISGLIQQAVQGQIVSRPDPSHTNLVTAVERALTDRFRRLLHHPQFQSLEAAWRGLQFLVHHLELGESIELHALDISRSELATELDAGAPNLRRWLIEEPVRTPGGHPWSLIVGLYAFDPSTEDLRALAQLAALAQAAGAPFLAGAGAGFQNPDLPPAAREAWTALRQSPAATSLGLLWPRFLLRLPYGASTDAINAFPFEEVAVPPRPADYLWGNPALLGAALLAQGFLEGGWDLNPDAVRELSGLPLHVYKEDGESKMTPCAELWLGHDAAEACLEQGLMPVQSIRGQDAVRVTRFQSISHPPQPLRGPWS